MLPKSAKLCTNLQIEDMYFKVLFKALELGIIDDWAYSRAKLYLFKSYTAWGKAYCGRTANFNYYDADPWICLNEVFLQDPTKAIITLVHEVCHLDRYSKGHDNRWKRNFQLLGSYFGVKKFTRCSSNEDIGLEFPQRQSKTDYKYGLKCSICGYVWKYKTNCDAIKHPENYRHNKCSKTKTLVSIVLDK